MLSAKGISSLYGTFSWMCSRSSVIFRMGWMRLRVSRPAIMAAAPIITMQLSTMAGRAAS